jgi:hypothetical protein
MTTKKYVNNDLDQWSKEELIDNILGLQLEVINLEERLRIRDTMIDIVSKYFNNREYLSEDEEKLLEDLDNVSKHI